MIKLNFDNMHKNKQHAFIDGFFTALVVTWIVKAIRKG